MSSSVQIADALATGASEAVRRGADSVLKAQRADGHWCGRLSGDTTLESDYLLLQLWLHPPVDGKWNPPNRQVVDKVAESVLSRQREDGGFAIYPGGPADLNATIKAYFAVKLAGIPAQDPRLQRARERIVVLGGVHAASSQVKATLSEFGLYPPEQTPTVPLAIELRPTSQGVAPAGFELAELFVGDGDPLNFQFGAWVAKRWYRFGPRRIREMELRKAEHRMLDRLQGPDGLEAIDIDDDSGVQIQPCSLPVWDTAIAAQAILESAGESAGELRKTADWLLDNPGRSAGDSAIVLVALKHLRSSDPERQEEIVGRAVNWLVAQQSRDGGWAACPDVTGQVLEALGERGREGSNPPVRRGVDYLIRTQETDGSWYGRRGVNYIYGTCFALRGLRAAGESDREAHVLRAGEWLRSIQNSDGGWGESCAGYETNQFEPAPSSPSQTAWATLGLLASGDDASDCVERGIRLLLDTQKEDGGWDETAATRTGMPRVTYWTADMQAKVFPLTALAGYLRAHQTRRGENQ